MQDLVQVRNIRNANYKLDEPVYSSTEMLNFLTTATSNPLEYQELGAAAEPSRLMMQHYHQQHYGSLPHSPQQKQYHSELSDFGNWRNSVPAPHQLTDQYWSLNNANNSLSYVYGAEKQLGLMHQNQNNSLQDVVKSITSNRSESEMASLMHHNGQGICVGNASELQLQPKPQSLSLSLSSSNITQNKSYVSHFEEGTSTTDEFQSMKHMKPSIISRDWGKSYQDLVVGIIPNAKSPASTSYGNLGPLGPFTGYATILKSSRFLKVAQNLLDGFCSPKLVTTCDVSETDVASKGSNYSCSSSSMFHNADWGNRSSLGVSLRPDYQQNKAKLMFMQEEVNRRYKQYHQQMQMVFSSFESVAGLNSATPYINLALKTVSKHFKCLNNAISNQLNHISEVLRNDLSIPTTTNSTKLADTNNLASLRGMDQSLQKNKPEKVPSGFHDPQQHHVWRPQRGFPERAVAILRAWLFEHFLHPYPTDTDKHLLATQTGLSRNQVSNWFINARVRVWKPMVEEVHMLDKKTAGASENSSPNERTYGTEVGSCSQPRMDKALNKFVMHSIPENEIQCMELGSSIDANAEENELNEAEQWSREKRYKLECGMSSRLDGTLMDFLPYRHSGHDVVRSLGLDLFH